MTANQKFTRGLILDLSGSVLLVLGLLLSMTGIGACLGIPMILAFRHFGKY